MIGRLGLHVKNYALTASHTGANSPIGIGRATAQQFAQNGAKAVYICDFDDKYLGHYQKELKSSYPSCEVHTRKFDAADEPAVVEVVGDALQRYGRLDVFFANAGITGNQTMFTDVSQEDFMETLRVNTLGWVVLIPTPSSATRANTLHQKDHSSAQNTPPKPWQRPRPTSPHPAGASS